MNSDNVPKLIFLILSFIAMVIFTAFIFYHRYKYGLRLIENNTIVSKKDEAGNIYKQMNVIAIIFLFIILTLLGCSTIAFFTVAMLPYFR